MNTISLNIAYLNTDYLLVNEKIDRILKKYLNLFYQNNNKNLSSFNMSFEDQELKDYLSIVIKTELNVGGAHPEYFIDTIIYNKKENQIITIDDFIKRRKYVLYELSKISRKLFLKNKTLTNKELILEGTKPLKENFTHFILTETGMKLFFPRYQIAPYYQGEFELLIPYKEFKK